MMLLIEQKENGILKAARDAQREGRKLYIYGAAEAGVSVFHAIDEAGITPDGFCVDEAYYQPGRSKCGLPIVCLDNFIGGGTACTVIVACMKNEPLKEYEGVTYVDKDFVTLYAPIRMSFSFMDAHINELRKLYEDLEDDISRQHMQIFLNQKLSGEFELEHVWVENQYYCKDVVSLTDVSCFVDCGAFDGDSYRAFCKNYEECTGESYAGKAYLIEPTREVFSKLADIYSAVTNVVTLECGAWDKKDTLYFKTIDYEPMSNKIQEGGEIEVQVDAIDNIVSEQDRVGFIKMDIEGSELNALKGAAKVIQRDKPVLAICVYHKKEDLITIPQYIRSLYPGYRLYLRAHERRARELVLYALPE